jgi:hypothetical protein
MVGFILSTCGGKMNDRGEAWVCFVGAHGDAFELLEFAEEVFDQVTPFVHFGVDRQFSGSALMLSDDDLGSPSVEIGDDSVAVEGRVGDQGAEAEAVDQRRHANSVVPMAGQEDESHEIPERVGERKNLGR